ncbi:hypothetical protein ACFL55_01280 [Candidatus Latescibacterota bacterium]
MKRNSKTIEEKNEKEVERIIEVLEFFFKQGKTFGDWMNEKDKRQEESSEKNYFNHLMQSGLLITAPLRNEELIFVTKDGYSFLNSYKFNKQSLKINEEVLQVSKHVKLICIATLIIAFISLLFSVCR